MTNSTKQTRRAKRAEPAPRMTKKDQLIKRLRGKSGVDVKTISEKLERQQHTTRAALTGLRRAGFKIGAEKHADGGPSRYRLIAEPTLPKPEPADAT